MDWPSCSSSLSASAALVLGSLPWERDGAGKRPSRQGPWSYALSSRCTPLVGPPSNLRLTPSSVPSRTGTPAALLLCSQPARRNSKALRDCRNLSWNLLVVAVFTSPSPPIPAPWPGLLPSSAHSTRALPSPLTCTSSAHTQSDHLAVNMFFRH